MPHTRDPHHHHRPFDCAQGRRSIRLPGYDTTQAEVYFVTICVRDRECLLGEIVDGEMRLNDAGRMVQSVRDELPAHYPGVEVDAFVVMPNHVHGIIVLTGHVGVGAGPRACPEPGATGGRETGQPQVAGQPQGVAPTGGVEMGQARRRQR